ncbi:hypothetical protein Gpo141_00006270 [Globisporangium polare]
MGISRVTCEFQYKSLKPVAVFDIRNSSGGSPQNPLSIARQFAGDTRRLPTTLSASCVFTYARGPIVDTPTSTVSHECTHEFKSVDCSAAAKGAKKSDSSEPKCSKKCSSASNSSPGLFEACGGDVISATKTATVLSREELACCESCNAQCKTVAPPSLTVLPDGLEEVKRCEPAEERV